MVGVAGFEPATPTSRTWCATRLRYTPTGGRSYNPGTSKRKLASIGRMNVETATRVLSADPEAIAKAADILAAGGLVAFPTETVYGLGADAANGEAVARLYAAKGRPAFNPLIAHVGTLASARMSWAGSMPRPSGSPPHSGRGRSRSCCRSSRTARLRSRARRARQRRGARAGAPGRAGTARRHSAGRWWRRRPIAPATFRRPDAAHVLADLRGPHRPGARRRAVHASASNRRSSPASASPLCFGPGGAAREDD